MRYPASKYSLTLKTGLGVVQGQLKMAPFNRSHAHLVRHCKYSNIVQFLSYLTLNNIVKLKSGLRSLKVIQISTIQKLGYGFLLALPYL